jgi:hypothetical protein
MRSWEEMRDEEWNNWESRKKEIERECVMLLNECISLLVQAAPACGREIHCQEYL